MFYKLFQLCFIRLGHKEEDFMSTQHVICNPARYLQQPSTLYVTTQHIICNPARYMQPSTLYATQHVICNNCSLARSQWNCYDAVYHSTIFHLTVIQKLQGVTQKHFTSLWSNSCKPSHKNILSHIVIQKLQGVTQEYFTLLWSKTCKISHKNILRHSDLIVAKSHAKIHENFDKYVFKAKF